MGITQSLHWELRQCAEDYLGFVIQSIMYRTYPSTILTISSALWCLGIIMSRGGSVPFTLTDIDDHDHKGVQACSFAIIVRWVKYRELDEKG